MDDCFDNGPIPQRPRGIPLPTLRTAHCPAAPIDADQTRTPGSILMKTCSYCGRENPEEAAACRECGTELNSPHPPPPREKKERFWNRPLSDDGIMERTARELGKTLRGRRCTCGHAMRPVSVEVRRFLFPTPKFSGATYQCTRCPQQCTISTGLKGSALFLGLFSPLPYLRPSQFSAVSACVYALLPVLSWVVFFWQCRVEKKFPEERK